jgi:hypothetical protein
VKSPVKKEQVEYKEELPMKEEKQNSKNNCIGKEIYGPQESKSEAER